MFQINFEELKKPNRIFTEIRYKPIYSLPENKYKILDRLSDKFSAHNITEESISLLDPNKGIQYFIEMGRLVIDWDKPSNIKEFSKICKPVINVVSEILKINKFERVGIRTFLVNEVNSLEDVFNYISQKFIHPNAQRFSLLGGKNITEPLVKFSGNKADYKYNLAVTFQQEQTIEAGFNTNITNVFRNLFLVDIDVYKVGEIKANNAISFFEDVEDFIYKNVFNYLKGIVEVENNGDSYHK
jgi:hypothetical protein